MIWLYILIGLLALLALAALVCFLITFYNPTRTAEGMAADRFPPGKAYEPYHPVLRQWAAQVDGMDCIPMEVTTPDGLTLRGKLYTLTPDAPVEILFHGYRGFSERDMCGAVQRCFAVGHSALLADQRAAGISDGHVITFGVKESEDVPLWIDAVAQRFGADHPVYIGGVSMGATTVLLSAGRDLPPQVKGVLADCGYSTAQEIIKKVIRQIKLPADLLYPVVRLGALLYGGFDPNRADATAAMRRCRVPTIFFHGAADDFVPHEMSRINYEACAAPKRLVITPDAGHGLCYPADVDGYVAQVKDFYNE